MVCKDLLLRHGPFCALAAALRTPLSAALAGALAFVALGVSEAGAQQEPERKLAPIDWPKAEADAARRGVEPLEAGRERAGIFLHFSPAQLARAENLNIPLLMPKSLIQANRRNQLDEPLTLISDETNYSSEAKLAPRNYVVSGTQVVFEIPGGVKPVEAPSDVYVEFADWGIEATFERYGALYSIAIYCAAPQSDPECTQEDKVRALAGEMVLATNE